jgi:hypothetical protein
MDSLVIETMFIREAVPCPTGTVSTIEEAIESGGASADP